MEVKSQTALLFLSLLAYAQQPLSSPVLSVDKVIEKAVTAMGGLDRIHAIHSLVFRGFHFEGSYQQEFEGSKLSNAVLVRMRPNLRMVGCRPQVPTCEGQWGRIVEAYDGKDGWELNWPKQRLVHAVNKAQQALRCGAEFDFLFIDYKQRGFTATYLGRLTMLGKDTEAVQIDQQGCSSAIYYFSPTTYQLLMTELKIPIHARGDLIETVAVYGEFKRVQGVSLPSRSEEVNLQTGEVIGGGEWTSITANTLSDPAIFHAPSTHPVGITAVVLAMLKEANSVSPQQMMKTYLAFRSTPEGTQADRRYDMNWLGFELLKVDKYSHAVAVFRQVIVEEPNSSSAYESLGEAYLQAKDKPNAIRAFERAIELGSKSVEVTKKLKRLRAGEEI